MKDIGFGVRSIQEDFLLTNDFSSMVSPEFWENGEEIVNYVVEHNYYEWYYSYAARKKFPVRRILEIGVRYGYSGMAMIMGSLANGSSPEYIGFDNGSYNVSPSFAENRMKNIISKENLRIKVFTADTQELKKFSSYLFGEFDIIHIDGAHSEKERLN